MKQSLLIALMLLLGLGVFLLFLLTMNLVIADETHNRIIEQTQSGNIISTSTIALFPNTRVPTSSMHQIVGTYEPIAIDIGDKTANSELISTTAFCSSSIIITEVLVHPENVEPDNEWIEIYNNGDCEIELGGYKLGDEETPGQGEGMFAFPTGTKIKPKQVIVIANQAKAFLASYGFQPDFEFNDTSSQVPNMEKYNQWSGGNINLANSGDEVLLLDSTDQVVDSLSWGTSNYSFDPPLAAPCSGCSFERFAYDPDLHVGLAQWEVQSEPNPGSVQFHPQVTPTDIIMDELSPTPLSVRQTITSHPSPSHTSTAVPIPFNGRLYISEVLYDPLGEEPEEEWVEIYNPGDENIILSNFKMGDEEQIGGSEGMYRFPEGASITAGGIVVVAVHAASFYTRYGFYPDYEIVNSNLGIPVLNKYTLWANGMFSLSNTGDEVLLLDGVDNVIDAISWGNSPFVFLPHQLSANPVCSLERVPANADTNSADDWREQCSPGPGSVDLVKPTALPDPMGTLSPTPRLTITVGKSPTVIVSVSPTLGRTATTTINDTLTPTSSPNPIPITNTTPTPNPAGRLVISQVMFWPASISGIDVSEPADEWIEISNLESNPVDLSLYKVGDAGIGDSGEGMYIFPPGARLEAGGIVIVANQADRFKGRYGRSPDYEIFDTDPSVPNMVKYDDWAWGTINLSNAGDEVFLLDAGNTEIDYVSWGNSQILLEPPILEYVQGQSVVRCPENAYPNTGANWQVNPAPTPEYTVCK